MRGSFYVRSTLLVEPDSLERVPVPSLAGKRPQTAKTEITLFIRSLSASRWNITDIAPPPTPLHTIPHHTTQHNTSRHELRILGRADFLGKPPQTALLPDLLDDDKESRRQGPRAPLASDGYGC